MDLLEFAIQLENARAGLSAQLGLSIKTFSAIDCFSGGFSSEKIEGFSCGPFVARGTDPKLSIWMRWTGAGASESRYVDLEKFDGSFSAALENCMMQLMLSLSNRANHCRQLERAIFDCIISLPSAEPTQSEHAEINSLS